MVGNEERAREHGRNDKRDGGEVDPRYNRDRIWIKGDEIHGLDDTIPGRKIDVRDSCGR